MCLWRRICICFVVVASLIPAAGSLVKAEVIVDTGPGGDLSAGGGLFSTQWQAGQFRVGYGCSLTSVSVWINTWPGELILTLYSDAGEVPDQALFTSSFQVPRRSGWLVLYTSSWYLSEGVYWIAFESIDVDYFAVVPQNAPQPLENYAIAGGCTGPPVPEYHEADGAQFGVRLYGDVVVSDLQTWGSVKALFR